MTAKISKDTHVTIYVLANPEPIEKILNGAETYLTIKIGKTKEGLDNDFLNDNDSTKMRVGGTYSSDGMHILAELIIAKTKKLKSDKDLHRPMIEDGFKHYSKYSSDVDIKPGEEWFDLNCSGVESLMQLKERAYSFVNHYVERLTGTDVRKHVKLRKSQLIAKERFFEKCEEFRTGKLSTEEFRCNIIAYLCPRFGKTIFILALFLELHRKYGHKALILPAYVLSAHGSFSRTIGRYEEFRCMEFIRAYDGDFKQQLENALNEDRLPVIAVSLCATDKTIFDPILELIDVKFRFKVIDEADYGAWTEQSRIIDNYLSK